MCGMISIFIIFFLTVLTSSLLSVGFYASCQFKTWELYDEADVEIKQAWPNPDDKMIFWWIRWYGGRILGDFWYKPVYGCLPCMGSLHSIIPLMIVIQLVGINQAWFLLAWPLVAMTTAGVNCLISIWWSR